MFDWAALPPPPPTDDDDDDDAERNRTRNAELPPQSRRPNDGTGRVRFRTVVHGGGGSSSSSGGDRACAMTRQSFRRQLRVFLWRNLLTKWRRRRETILEIAMPLLFVGLIGMMRGMLPPVAVPEIPDYPMTHAQTSTMAAPGIDDILAQSRGLRILFAPSATHPVPIPVLPDC